jgi:hypothetical protein
MFVLLRWFMVLVMRMLITRCTLLRLRASLFRGASLYVGEKSLYIGG